MRSRITTVPKLYVRQKSFKMELNPSRLSVFVAAVIIRRWACKLRRYDAARLISVTEEERRGWRIYLTEIGRTYQEELALSKAFGEPDAMRVLSWVPRSGKKPSKWEMQVS